MGFSFVTVKFIIAKDDLLKALLGEPVETKTLEGKKITIHELTDHQIKMKLAEGMVVHQFDASISINDRTHQSHGGTLVNLVGGFHYVGEFVLEVYPDNNTCE